MTTATEAPGGEPRTVSAVGATVEVAGLGHRFGELEVSRPARPRGRRRRGRRPRRAVGLRQVDPARADRRPARARARHRGESTASAARRSGWPAAPTCPSATCCCPGSRRSTTPRWRRATAAPRGRTPGSGPRRCSSASGSPGFERRVRPSSPAGCASGSPSCARCWPASRCCCSTSRSPRSTRSPAPRCRSGSPGRWPSSRRPSSSSPTTSRRRSTSATGSAVLTARPARALATVDARRRPRSAPRLEAVTVAGVHRRARAGARGARRGARG